MRGYTYSSCIRAFCLDCMGFSVRLVTDCPSKTCLFYHFRFAKRAYPRPPLHPLQALRLKCLECVGNPDEVTKCNNIDCPIHLYRDRKIPSRIINEMAKSSRNPSKLKLELDQLSLKLSVTNDLG